MVVATGNAKATGMLDCDDVVELEEDAFGGETEELDEDVELVNAVVEEELAKREYPATAATTKITITTAATRGVEIDRTLFLLCILWRKYGSEISIFTNYEALQHYAESP